MQKASIIWQIGSVDNAMYPEGLLQVLLYAMRLACSMLLLEVMSHTLYFNSITRYSLWQLYGAQLQLTAVDMGIISFWVLMFMWLKVSLHSTVALPALLQHFCVSMFASSASAQTAISMYSCHGVM